MLFNARKKTLHGFRSKMKADVSKYSKIKYAENKDDTHGNNKICYYTKSSKYSESCIVAVNEENRR